MAKGVQANWIHRGAPRPANPVRRHPAKSVCTVVRMIMILDVDVTAERRHYNTHRPLKGKRLTTFCASLALLQPLLSLTHWIFRSLMLPYKSSSLVHPLLSLTHWIFRSLTLPYKSSSLVQNMFAVHCFARGAADWRSGPRWTILSVLCPVHPFATTWHFPSRGNERYEGKNSESYTSGIISAFSPFGGWRHHLPPTSWWDYGCLAMEPCLCRKA